MHNHPLIEIAQHAGKLIMSIYQQSSFQIMEKTPGDLLTEADLASHQFICGALTQAFPGIPIISEENSQQLDYAQRKNFNAFFLVDPLDGTKEFIRKNDEFTVNIALLQENKPVFGVVYAPALKTLYFAQKNQGAYKITGNKIKTLPRRNPSENQRRVVVSRSHLCDKTQQFLDNIQKMNKPYQLISAGSALKFALLAEGNADIYPRFSPTMEWDTAAGDILAQETAHEVIAVDNDGILCYNKPELVNPGFIVQLPMGD